MSTLVVDMDGAAKVDWVGGKADALARLVAAGFDVPAFIVISPAAFLADRLAPAVDTEFAAKLKAIGAERYAVRSSAASEDSAAHSHAGQFLSLLNVTPKDVGSSAVKVWQSGATESLEAYRKARGIEATTDRPAVIVQAMIASRVAGIAFSADPVSGDRDMVVISATPGLGDKLAGGETEGLTYRYRRTTREPVTPDPEIGDGLSPDEVAQIAQLAIKLEAFFGSPQDIEWAFERDRLYLLQSRPITTLPATPRDARASRIFDNANIVESYPGIVSPLTFSFAQYIYAHVYRALTRLLGVSPDAIRRQGKTFDHLLAHIDGRVYYDLINWYRVLALLPAFELNRRYMELMMGVDEPLPETLVEQVVAERDVARSKWIVRLRLTWVGLGMVWHAVRLPRTISRFMARLNDALAEPIPSGADATLDAHAAAYRRLERALLERWDAPLINDLICMIAFGASRKVLERWAGSDGIRLHNDVLIGQGDIVSAEPAQWIRAMGVLVAEHETIRDRLVKGDVMAIDDLPELAESLDQYLQKFGDRCAEELKLESVPLTEDPAPIIAAIAAAARPHARAKQERIDLRMRLRELFPRSPLRRWIARCLLRWARARVRDRENLRFERTRLFGRVRRLVRAMGTELAKRSVIGRPDDVFFLTIGELIATGEAATLSPDLGKTAKDRRAGQEDDRSRPDPPHRIEMPAGSKKWRAVRPSKAPEYEVPDVRHGLGCSAGVVAGNAKVVRDPKSETVQAGEILIARFTDPGWIALFASAAGIVVERGSLLSHSAIVAREMGIPCVVALKGALDWIETGERIEIDGETGQVSKIDG
ncbi:MAG: PEP-utilizing enzyme [Alphaproteobacteria bacterium]|nr:PEP-utilizing enzyme [Alphaproteobacteria bacterium]